MATVNTGCTYNCFPVLIKVKFVLLCFWLTSQEALLKQIIDRNNIQHILLNCTCVQSRLENLLIGLHVKTVLPSSSNLTKAFCPTIFLAVSDFNKDFTVVLSNFVNRKFNNTHDSDAKDNLVKGTYIFILENFVITQINLGKR